jgi:HlyD family secretion protein
MKKIISFVLVLALLGGGVFWYWKAHAASGTTFRFAEVKRGRVVATVGSTGTLQPSELVDIGAQVVGRIVSIGKDPNTKSGFVDWGSAVTGPVLDKDGKIEKSGTVLAQIDPDLYDAQAKAAAASVKAAEADLMQKTAMLNQTTADWGRAQALFATGGVAQAEYDQCKANYGVALANVDSSKANIGVAKANLKTAQTNLNYATITSPCDGTVIDRRVNVGQTVVASLSAPSLFLIAKDLTKMEVWATVNEVDVGKIVGGQKVKFTVDAVPGKTYHGQVIPQGKLPYRLNATMNQNVVTYTVVVSADNEDNLLKPYWTTNLSFIVADKKDVLVVPNAGLRWQPAKQQIAPDVREAYYALKTKKRAPTDTDTQDRGFVWIAGDDGLVRYIEVQTGLSDTVNTEVLSSLSGGEVTEHTAVIVAEGKAETQSGGSANPFVASPFAPKKKD